MTKTDNQKNKGDWFQLLVEQIEASVVESRFASQEIVIVGKHEIGLAVTENALSQDVKESELTALIAEASGVTQRTIQQCVQFYKFDPHLKTLQQGKNISWRKILNKFQEPKKKEEKEVKIEHMWLGKPLSECTKKELMEAIKHLTLKVNKSDGVCEIDKL